LRLLARRFWRLTIWATAVTTVPIGFVLMGVFALGLSVGVVMMIRPDAETARDAD
jgi:hypothetical protein